MPHIAIKATHITNLTDARYFAVFAEWIGFNLEPKTPQVLHTDTARELIGWLSGVRIVGEFGNSSVAYINTVANALQLDTIEVAQSVVLTGLSPIVSSIIRRVNISLATQAEDLGIWLLAQNDHTAAFVLDFSAGGYTWQSLQKHPIWQQGYLQQWCRSYPIIIKLPFDAQNVGNIIATLQPLGIELQGSDEQSIGMKAFDDINAIIEALDL